MFLQKSSCLIYTKKQLKQGNSKNLPFYGQNFQYFPDVLWGEN